MTLTWMILGMAVVTWATKATLFVVGSRAVFPPWLRLALDFVPVAVLTAILVPIVLAPHGGELELHWRNAHLVAALAAVGVCFATRHQMLTIGAGLALFLAWQFWVA